MATGLDATLGKQDTRFFGHPRGLATLFMTELWERFSYYGMRALLILFMTASVSAGGLGFDTSKAGAIYGLYTSMVYMLSLPGGWIADQLTGQRKAVLYGGIVIALGNFLLATPGITSFYIGLALTAMGTGLLKPNVSVIVGQLYSEADTRRDAAFSIFYMGINLGAFLSPLACGYVGQNVNWRLGFGLAGLGMTLGIIQYVAGGKHLGEAGMHPGGRGTEEAQVRTKRRLLVTSVVVAAALAVLAVLHFSGVAHLSAQGISDAMGVLLLLTVAAFFLWLLSSRGWTAVERRRLLVVGVLFVASSLFWCMFEQAGSTLNLFAERSTDKSVLGWSFPASWLQSVNALFIITLAPAFAWLWVKLGSSEPSSPAKFVLGLFCGGTGFAVLAAAATQAEDGTLVSPAWLVAVYLLHTSGELCLSPVGLSAMTKLAPARITGLLMGVWFLSISVGNYLGGRFASMYETLPLERLFGAVALFGVAMGLILAMFIGPIKRLMAGVK